MSYRHKRTDHVAERAWRAWLEAHRDMLASSGLPLELYSSRVSWEDFLSSGLTVFASGHDRRELDFNAPTVSQQQKLLALLEHLVGAHEPPPGLLSFLRVRAAASWKFPLAATEPAQHEGEPPTGPVQCPCCDYFSLSSQGEYEICNVCFWEDDGVNLGDLDQWSGPNHMTLRDARENFCRIGACDDRAVAHVLPEADGGRFRWVPR